MRNKITDLVIKTSSANSKQLNGCRFKLNFDKRSLFTLEWKIFQPSFIKENSGKENNIVVDRLRFQNEQVERRKNKLVIFNQFSKRTIAAGIIKREKYNIIGSKLAQNLVIKHALRSTGRGWCTKRKKLVQVQVSYRTCVTTPRYRSVETSHKQV